MKNVLFIFLALFFALTCSSQEIYLDIHGKKASFFTALEKKNGNLAYNDGTEHISIDKDIAQPLIFRRSEKTIPDLLVYYTFSKTDSLMDHVLYEWDVSNFEKSDHNKKSAVFEQLLVEKYKKLLAYVTAKFGKSESKGDLENLSQSEMPNGISKSDSWKPNDSTEVKLHTTISNFYEKKGMVTTTPTHKIRLYV